MVTTTLISLATFVSGGIIGYGLYAAGKKAGLKLGKEQAEMEANLQALRASLFNRAAAPTIDHILPLMLASFCLDKAGPFNTAAPCPKPEPCPQQPPADVKTI